MNARIISIVSLAGLAATVHADVFNVPGDFPTIQQAMDAASDGDEVVVGDGTWTGDGNWDLMYNGKDIVVRSSNGPDSCTIDLSGAPFGEYPRAAIFNNVEGPDAVFEGFKVIGGTNHLGAAISVSVFADPTIKDCHFEGNQANAFQDECFGWGGAIAFEDSEATVIGCVFDFNEAYGNCNPGLGGAIYAETSSITVEDCEFHSSNSDFGGAIYLDQSDLTLVDSLFEGNSAAVGGAIADSEDGASSMHVMSSDFQFNFAFGFDGVYGYGGAISAEGDLTVTNSVFANNEAGEGKSTGGAIKSDGAVIHSSTIVDNMSYSSTDPVNMGGVDDANATVANSIFWGNMSDQHVLQINPPSTVTYSVVQGGMAGAGNIDADPELSDDFGDFTLKPTSPCIDAGNTFSLPLDVLDIDNDGDSTELLPLDQAGNPRASDDPNTNDTGVGAPLPVTDMGAFELENVCIADFNGDGVLNILDFVAFQQGWNAMDPKADCDLNGQFNILDFVCFQFKFSEGCD